MSDTNGALNTGTLEEKASWIRRETLKIHARAGGTRLASSLSPVEICTALYYGWDLRFKPEEPLWEERDRIIFSKGHGTICMYPVFADLGFFNLSELENVCRSGSFLGSIPDPIIPGYETVNGSLGHGPGVGAGMALALRLKKSLSRVAVLCGEGELFEGSVWEAFMFAAHHRLGNLTVILDYNKISMLGYTEKIVTLEPLPQKLESFGWEVHTVPDGHNISDLISVLNKIPRNTSGKPLFIIAHTVKGKGVDSLERNPLCHVATVSPEEIEKLLGEKI